LVKGEIGMHTQYNKENRTIGHQGRQDGDVGVNCPTKLYQAVS
jgi:hypothetical protein